jgi:hypothetical protein
VLSRTSGGDSQINPSKAVDGRDSGRPARRRWKAGSLWIILQCLRTYAEPIAITEQKMKRAHYRLGSLLVTGIAAFEVFGFVGTAQARESSEVRVVDGIVMPRRPVAESLADAMQFLKKADGNYVPGNIDGELAGYFTTAFVNEDGSKADRPLSFPARHHAYFIVTFLRYADFSGEQEWTERARDLADWNLAHSTPADAIYANIPYSVFSKGQPGGSKDKDSTEPDKAAFIGSAYVALFEATSDAKYLDAARAIADTLAEHQNDDGSWPFRVVPETGVVRQHSGGAPVFFVQFFDDMLRQDENPSYREAHDAALQVMLQRNVKNNQWGTYHEDIGERALSHLSAEPMCFTADYLFRHAGPHPEYVEMGRGILRRLEDRLVHTDGHPAAPAPAVSEQAGFEHMMPGHTARYCQALASLYAATADEEAHRKAVSGINALTYMQAENGLYGTFFQKVKEKNPNKKRMNWYSQHLYTVCHVLQSMPLLPGYEQVSRP